MDRLLALMGFIAATSVAWQRAPIDTQKCLQDGKNMQRCTKENTEDNEYTFSAQLSPDIFKIYNNFTPDQKKMALDNADNNQMTPNAAVKQVAGQ